MISKETYARLRECNDRYDKDVISRKIWETQVQGILDTAYREDAQEAEKLSKRLGVSIPK